MKKTDEEILETALKRFREIEDYEAEQRREMIADKKFGLGEQWNKDDQNKRFSQRRPCITINRSVQFTDYIKNEQRENRVSIKISPTDEGIQEKYAERRQGLVRHIQYDSKSVMARQQAFDDSVDMGRGHYLVTTAWESPNSFNKKIVVEPIQNPLSVYMDITRKKPDYSDCEFGFIIEKMRKEAFEEQYPKANKSDTFSNSVPDSWRSADFVTIANYYYKQPKKRKLLMIEADGKQRKLYEDELQRDLHKYEKIVAEREVETAEWHWCLITGHEIIDKEITPFTEIPIITSIGRETVVDGKLSLKGLLRDIKDPLMGYNYYSTQEIEIISKAPKAPWIMAEGQDEGRQEDWARSNVEDVAALIYKPVTFEGHLVPPPHFNQFPGVSPSIINQKREYLEDCKAITGIHDASLGIKSNETSGVAIKARQRQGRTSTFHYTLNAEHSLNHEGRVIDSALGSIYDSERTIMIMGENDEQSALKINGADDGGLGEGDYNVTVSTGPNSNTSREEQASGMLELVSQVGLVQNVASDLVVRSQDWSGKDALADRLEFAIEKQFPGITTQKKEEEGEDARLMMLQQQLQQSQGQMQQMGQQMQQMQQALQKAQADKQAAEAGKVQIEMQKVQVEMQKLEIERDRLKLEAGKIQGELAAQNRKIDADMMKADLESETRYKINKDQLEVELIKEVNNDNRSERSIEKESLPKLPEVKQEKAAAPVVNVYGSKKRKSIVSKKENGEYEVTTTEED